VADWRAGIPVSEISAVFHNTLAEMIVTMARQTGEKRVVLSGGCFQNKMLLERTIQRLLAEGFQPYWHRTIPPNDGGIALGQIMAALRE
jgi:hydrogenase maturation protein HypF